MRANPSVNQHLNLVLKTALVAINQYFLHARMLGSWGLDGLELQEYQAAIRAMKHADKVMSRILSLNGDPAGLSLRDLGKLLVGENVSDLLGNDLKMESVYRDSLARAISHCKTQNDRVSRQNLEALHAESEHRIEWLRGQLGLIDRIGTQGYLDSSTTTVSSTLAPPASTITKPTKPTKPLKADGDEPETVRAPVPSRALRVAGKDGDSHAKPDPASKAHRSEKPRRRSATSRRSVDKAKDADAKLPVFAAKPSARVVAKAKRVDEDSSSFILSSYFAAQPDRN